MLSSGVGTWQTIHRFGDRRFSGISGIDSILGMSLAMQQLLFSWILIDPSFRPIKLD